MATQESNIVQQIRIAASKIGSRLFRNNRGLFLTLDGSRKVRAGLEAPGSSDLIGWHTVEITPAMVGHKIAVFTAAEGKTEKGKASDDQKTFIKIVLDNGGIAGVVRDGADYESLIKTFTDRF